MIRDAQRGRRTSAEAPKDNISVKSVNQINGLGLICATNWCQIARDREDSPPHRPPYRGEQNLYYIREGETDFFKKGPEG